MIRKNLSVDEILNEFNNKSRLSDLISKYVQLTPRGNSFIGKCPFHNEKTPSFNVSDEKGLFHCFGCKVGGNAITFLMKYKNLSFKEAINELSIFAGLNINFQSSSDLKKKNDLLSLFFEANVFFKDSLKLNKGAYQYISSRIKNNDVISNFEIGYCPSDEELIKFLDQKGFGLEEIKKTDLLIRNSQNQYFGRFKNRLIFPIFNFSEKIVGFGGREINGNSKIKYINSQESEIFKKSEILFGLKQNQESIRKNKIIILVEGYMDVISLAENDINLAVASMGTSLSKTQILKMWNLSNIPYICFDGDEAGRNSSKIIATKILEFLVPGKSFKFIRLPENYDPDSFLKKWNKKAFDDLMNKSYDLSDLIWQIILESIGKTTPEFIALLDEKIRFYSSKISNKKVSDEYYRFLIKKKNDYLWNIKSKKRFKKFTKEKIQEFINEKLIIIFILFETKLVQKHLEEISEIKFQNSDFNKTKDFFFRKIYLENLKVDSDLLKNLKNNFFSKEEVDSLKKTHIANLNENEKAIFLQQILTNLKLPELQNEVNRLKELISNTNDNKKQTDLIIKYNKILHEIKIIKNKELE
ncbi:MAG: DNA primase [Alphaproteobacteria bacterium]|nr:DNA primase [Alphaproteobacteria bacterium]